MEIYPSKSEFIRLSCESIRVPICGEDTVPHLPIDEFFDYLYGDSKNAFLLESAGEIDLNAKYVIMGLGTPPFISIPNIGNSPNQQSDVKEWKSNANKQLCRLNFSNKIKSFDYLSHFWGGWVGFFSYEMGHFFEDLPTPSKDELGLPFLYFMTVENLWVYDRESGVLKYLVSNELGDESSESIFDENVDKINKAWGLIKKFHKWNKNNKERNDSKTENKSFSPPINLRSNFSQNNYQDIVKRAKNYIQEGDIYQANLAQRFSIDYAKDSLSLYRKLKMINPSPFSSYFNFESFSIVSSSPERLLKINGNHLETRPIAGTRPRGKDFVQDNKLSAELLLNEKELAEHLMLVDLERNDMGRVCEYGSVEVTDLMFLEKYSHVIHIVSNIIGKLSSKASVIEIIRALFPGGTITGCPKIRCMEIINELETVQRGPYSGSLGYIGFSQWVDLNIVIRTIIIKNGQAYFHVGAGIVADSIPEKEYIETLDKAAAMKKALGLEL
jgi:anthranilate synthase component 1/para-aminobenzoate synthetase component 1